MRFLFFTFFFNALTIFGQSTSPNDGKNIVPNPSFEEFRGYPIGWYYKGDDFTNVVKHWSSPTAASPDAYSPRVRVPTMWTEKGFGKHKPHTGGGMAGITIFGCDGEKPHCREYVQIQLKEPLVVGQRYEFEIWVLRLPQAVPTNNLGAAVVEKMIKMGTDDRLPLKPQALFDQIIYAEQWTRLCDTFTAQSVGEWLVLGNFETDKMTSHKPHLSNYERVSFGYYHIDDVSLRKIPPILPFVAPPDDWSKQPLKRGKTIVLDNVLFDSDQAELLPRSEIELQKLLKILKQNPTLTIKIKGHTDSNGDETYNIALSQRRAVQVANWLTTRGIAKNRLQTAGFGSAMPLASNETEETRAQNRRVEFEILSE
jgi:OmpA-OmpF porin, OOP family